MSSPTTPLAVRFDERTVTVEDGAAHTEHSRPDDASGAQPLPPPPEGSAAAQGASPEPHTRRHAFVVPDVEPNIEFKRVRRSDAEGSPAGPAPRKGLRLRRWHVAAAAGVVLVLLVGVGWVGLQGRDAANHLQSAARLFGQLQRQLEAGDADAARSTLPALQQEISAARRETAGPAWRLASASPKLGDDLTAVHTISVALDEFATRGLPPLVEVAASLKTALLAPTNGQLDLAALRNATAAIGDAETVIRRANDRVSAIPTAGLAPQIATAVTQLTGGLDRAEALIGPAGRAANLLPPMLGAAGPRTYLVMFQNLAEVRATGGMPGAFIVVEANNGAIKIVDQGTAATTLKTFPTSVLPLNEDQLDLHTDRLGTYPADVNLTPDFPTAAVLFREMYRIRSGRTVDGVMATDPVALAHLLRATGPVPMPAGPPLAADTAVRRLLNEVYLTTPSPVQQDVFFAGAANAVFTALMTRQGDPRALLAALARAAGERRLLMWSANPEEQQQLAGTMLGGQLPADDGAKPTVGVFLNDGSGAKLGYYLTHSAALAVGDCMEDGTVELRLKVTLGSTAPASGLPPSITGMGLSGDPHTVRTNLMVYTPTGGAVVEALLDGSPVEFGTGIEQARAVGVLTVDLPPGATKSVDFTVLTDVLPAAATTTPRLWTTPGVAPWETSISPGQGCSK